MTLLGEITVAIETLQKGELVTDVQVEEKKEEEVKTVDTAVA